MMTADEYKEAEFGFTLAESKRGWRIHAVVYTVVMTGLLVLNGLLIAFTDGDFPWALFPLVCWGFGLGVHYVFGVRRAARIIRDRQETIERYVERPRVTA
jgi:hypothetical protein